MRQAGADIGRYGRVAVTFHWTIAALVLANLAIGIGHELVFEGWIVIHKPIGITVLALTVARLAWRLAHRPPPLPREIAPWQRRLAHAVHWGLYALMLLMPLSGWIFTSASAKPRPITFGLFQLGPLPIPPSETVNAVGGQAHEVLGWIMLALVALHVAGALKHQLIDGVPILRRIWPGAARSRSGWNVRGV